ncbi:uncharacterized protein LOC143908720 [Temnothorax americanus]|uniref:uncharacterized protein LOC143908720 n=1 Tax=Temnothorax americanus TaxID=1964332 RepID=UPI004068A3FB
MWTLHDRCRKYGCGSIKSKVAPSLRNVAKCCDGPSKVKDDTSTPISSRRCRQFCMRLAFVEESIPFTKKYPKGIFHLPSNATAMKTNASFAKGMSSHVSIPDPTFT